MAHGLEADTPSLDHELVEPAAARPPERLADPNDYRTKLDGSTLWQLALLELWLQRQLAG
jgi:hypothetical protein